ncbi:MAG: FtsX-like permease family protein, partial [Bacteroidota bacterium]
MNNWLGQTVFTYVVLKNKEAALSLTPKFESFMQRHFPERAESYFLYLQPLNEVYLHSDDITFSKRLKMSSAIYLRVFGMAALFILLIACVNYINNNTARATRRASEVGMRKALGANRFQLIIQFLGESFLLTIISAVLALLIVDILLPYFNSLSGKELDFVALTNGSVLGYTVMIVITTALLSGFYPALVLSGFKPIRALKLSSVSNKAGNLPRQVLTVTQFIIAIVMIASTLIVFEQTDFLKNKDLGFDKERLVVMNINNDIENRTDEFLDALKLNPDVLAVSACQATIGNGTFGTTVLPEGADQELSISLFRTDANFINTIGMNIAEGRAFNPDLSSDSASIIVNQTFVDLAGWESGVEKQVRFSAESPAYPIIGVVEDFHFQGLAQYAVEPVIMYIEARNLYNVTVRISGNNIPETLSYFEEVWGQYES